MQRNAENEHVAARPQVDLLPEITMTPLFRAPAESLIPGPLRSEVQTYIASRQPPSFPGTLARRMALSPTDALLCDARYNIPMLNAFVFHVGLTVGTFPAGPVLPSGCCHGCMASFLAGTYLHFFNEDE